MQNAFYHCYKNEDRFFHFGFSVLLLAPLALMLGIAPIDAVSMTVGTLFIIRSFYLKDFSWLKETWFQIFLILWLYMIVRSFFTIQPLISITQSFIFIRFAIFCLALQYWLLKKSTAREALIWSLILTLCLASFDGILQLLTGNDFLGHHIEINPAIQWRLTAISGKQNIGAKFSMVALPAIIYLLNYAKLASRLFLKLASSSLAFAFIIFIPLTGERNATLMIMLGLILLFIFYKPIRFQLFLMLMAFVLCLATLIYLSPGFKSRIAATQETINKVITVDSSTENGAGVSPYVSLLKTDWNIFVANPIFGVGRKQYNIYCKQAPVEIATTKTEINQCITNAQNIYFEWLDENGLIGLVLFLTIIFLWFKQFYLNRKLLLANGIALAAIVELMIRLWPLASTSSFFFAWCGGPFWLMAGFALAYLRENKFEAI